MQAARLACLAVLLFAGEVLAYEPPQGFNGHEWGSSLANFASTLKLWGAKTVTHSKGKVTYLDMRCPNEPVGLHCSPVEMETVQKVEGRGAHAMAEYMLAEDQNPWASDGVRLLSISYLFCASVEGALLPRPVTPLLRLCGTRLRFTSDPQDVLANQPDGYRSNFDRLLRRLVQDHGPPPGFRQRGRVSVEGLSEADEPDTREAPVPRLLHYRWCGQDMDHDRRLYPPCPATVSLAYDRTRGEGVVLFAAAPLYAYAWAVQQAGDANNEIYRMLDDLPLDQQAPQVRTQCTGTLICNPTRSAMTDIQRNDFEIRQGVTR